MRVRSNRNLTKLLSTFSKEDLLNFYNCKSGERLRDMTNKQLFLNAGLLTSDTLITELGSELFKWLELGHHLGQKVFFQNEYAAYIEGISSSYDEFLKHLKFDQPVSTLVEIGTFNGGGTEHLIKEFPEAKIYTFERQAPSEPQYSNLDLLEKKLLGRAELIIEESPPSNFSSNIDLCVYDIGGNSEIILENFNFWYSLLNEGGHLAMLVPWSTQKKRKTRQEVLKQLDAMTKRYLEYVNWIVIKK